MLVKLFTQQSEQKKAATIVTASSANGLQFSFG
jgi:hypothetical protein